MNLSIPGFSHKKFFETCSLNTLMKTVVVKGFQAPTQSRRILSSFGEICLKEEKHLSLFCSGTWIVFELAYPQNHFSNVKF